MRGATALRGGGVGEGDEKWCVDICARRATEWKTFRKDSSVIVPAEVLKGGGMSVSVSKYVGVASRWEMIG